MKNSQGGDGASGRSFSKSKRETDSDKQHREERSRPLRPPLPSPHRHRRFCLVFRLWFFCRVPSVIKRLIHDPPEATLRQIKSLFPPQYSSPSNRLSASYTTVGPISCLFTFCDRALVVQSVKPSSRGSRHDLLSACLSQVVVHSRFVG
jgi:hypothetical protein